MKLSKDKEAECISIRGLCEQLEEELNTMKSENLELYRRLRYLRACARETNQSANFIDQANSSMALEFGMESEVMGTNQANSNMRRVKRDGKGIGMDMGNESSNMNRADNLDHKYTTMYEERLDPFKLEELDRQALISRLNVIERGLAYIIKLFMQDSLARKAFVVYIILMHIFSFAYVIQVLNPQLIDEVDSYTKARYEAETFDMNIDREHPDI